MAFSACGDVDLEFLLARWGDLDSALQNSQAMAVVVPPELGSALKSLTLVDAKLDEVNYKLVQGGGLVPPPLWEPVFEEPAYRGAWWLSGRYRGDYTDADGLIEGVVITAGDRTFVVLDAEPMGSQVRNLEGYVDATGRQIALDDGGGGVRADVVRLTHRDKYLGDSAAHRARVHEAQDAHKRELAAYQQARGEQADAVARLDSALASLEAERRMLEDLMMETLEPTAIAVRTHYLRQQCE